MTPAEVATLLAVCTVYDGRFARDGEDVQAATVQAWASSLDSDMPFTFARDVVVQHYANDTAMLTIAEVNRRWRSSVIDRRTGTTSQHAALCPNPDLCACSHSTCYAGWIDVEASDGRTVAAPCPNCRPDQAERVAAIPPPGERGSADLARLRRTTT